MELRPGETFAGRYRIERILGRGGMGCVYRARDLSLDETVALKTLGIEATPAATKRFRNEVRLARRITHRNVARVFDLGEHEGNLFLTMEHVEGATLREKLREGKLSTPQAVSIAVDLCEGLSVAHSAGVVHRDLKPTNVLIERATNRVVMVDFGIAHAIGEESGLTQGAIGTPRYMAPEQAVVGEIDGRTDLYLLGLILFEMAIGRAPDVRKLPSDLLLLPAPLAQIVENCLRQERAARPANAMEVARALRSIDLAAERAMPATERALHADGTPAVVVDASTVAGIGAQPTVLSTKSHVTQTTTQRTLAVLPFRYRGAPDREWLGEALAEELVDVLSNVRRLRVLGTGVTSRFREDRDPRRIAEELGAVVVVDGSLQLVGEGDARTLRLTVRLHDREGAQIDSEKFEGKFEEALDLGDSIARRIAEHLRLELTIFASRGDAPPEAIDLYLSGRRRARWYYSSSDTALDELERAIELAPSFAPAYATYALASTRAYFARDVSSWAKNAEKALARASQMAPDHAETQHALSSWSIQHGEYHRAREAIDRAIALAPTYAEAHEYLGMILLEIGEEARGLAEVRLAHELDPVRSFALLHAARNEALRRRWEETHRILDAFERRGDRRALPVVALRVRTAAWRGALDEVVPLIAEVDAEMSKLGRLQPAFYAKAMLGELPLEEYARALAAAPPSQSRRLATLQKQMACEVWCRFGHLDRALVALDAAADDVLVDLTWLDFCPLLAPIRSTPGFAEARRRTLARAATFSI